MKSEIQINAIRKGLVKNSEGGKTSRGYFSIYAVFEEGEKEIPIAETESDIEVFDESINYAKENKAVEIIIVKHSKKTEPRTKKNEYRIRTNESKANNQTNQESVMKMIDEKMQKLQENLSINNDEPGGLGMIKQEYGHQAEILRLTTEHKFKIIEFERKIESLQRQLDEKDETIIESANEIEGLKKELEELENEYEQYKDDKFAGLSEQLKSVGNNVLSGLVAKALPLLTGGDQGVAGMDETQNAGGGTTIVEEDTNPLVEQIIAEIRGVITSYNEMQLKQFYELMIYIAQDPATNLSTITELIK